MRGYVLIPPIAFSVFLLFTNTSAMLCSWWHPFWSTLSDLGRNYNHDSQIIFNAGCWISGILLSIGGVWKSLCEDGLNKAGGILLAIAGAGLFAVGFATGDYPQAHDIATAVLFIFALGAMALITLDDVMNKDRLVLYSSLLIGLVMLIQWPLLYGGTQELVMILGAAAWSMVQVYKYYKSGKLFE